MKKKEFLVFLSLVLIFGQSLRAQKEAPELPIDKETRKISYSEVVQLDSILSKSELFSRAREWFAKAYKSSTNVVQMEDKESGKIIGKALMQVYHRALGSDYPSGHINYTISIYLKDGRYKYVITDFHHTGQLVNGGNRVPDYGPCEDMINTTKKSMGMSYQKMFNYYLNQMDNDIRALIANLKLEMSKPSSGVKKDEW